MDFSTLNIDVLKQLPVLAPAVLDKHGWHVSGQMGEGCAGDPPGYPTYFLRSVYNRHGNSPDTGPQTVITFEGVHYIVRTSEDWKPGDTWEDVSARFQELMRSLWLPPAYESKRVQGWIRETYRHHAHCYIDDARLLATEQDHRNMVVIPVPDYKLAHFYDDPRFSDTWRETEKAAVAVKNAEIQWLAALVGVPENHDAYRLVSRYYPQHTPDLALIADPPTSVGGQWWETEAEQPTPEKCRPRSCGPHPVNKTWCQWCGWVTPEVAEAMQDQDGEGPREVKP